MVCLDHIWQENQMPSARDFIHVGPELPAHGGVLTPSIRRDLADLNRQYLELALAPELSIDPRFAWCDTVRSRLAGTDAAARSRMAACPFALFEIQLPAEHRPVAPLAPSRIEEGPVFTAGGAPWQARCLEFAQFALFMALRLADAAPLAIRMTLGLSSLAELRLYDLRPSEVAQFAARPDVVRPRWPAHPRFWAMLHGAAVIDSASLLQSAHCLGICLLGPNFTALAPRPTRTR
jgi:hypothetical protein